MQIFQECLQCCEFFLTWKNVKIKRKFCSIKCKANWQSINLCEKNAPSWKGGKPKCIGCGQKCDDESTRCKRCYIKYINNNVITKQSSKEKSLIIKICKTCGNEYEIKRKLRTSTSKYCSSECFNKRGKDLTKKSYHTKVFCLDCNLPLKNKNAKFCRSCFGKHQSQENHPNWKDNATVKQRGMRWTYEYRIWRQSILKRDNYLCQMPECNKDYNLQVHHIETMKKSPDMIYNLDNGITLCKNCHLSIASKEQDYEQIFKNIVSNRLCLV